MIVDTHAHLMSKDFEGEVEDVIQRAKDAGVGKIINIGFDIESSMQAIALLDQWEGFYAVLGVSPFDAAEISEELLDEWKILIENNERIVGIGECGLDYVNAEVDKDLQLKAFHMQLSLAQQTGVPLIIHNRDADADCLALLDEFNGIDSEDRAKVVFHCFGSDLEFAKAVWIRGYYTSLAGIVTFPSAENLREVALEMPLDKFLIETDSPYLAPQAYRGNRNEPAYVVEVLKKIAELKGIDFSELEEQVFENTLRFFDRI